ncbi:MAG TPA: RluA family pseudouridine synthase [Gemmataceae bacterium]|jgi:23S rRNA pseudouridine1911/1915/1917 synthase
MEPAVLFEDNHCLAVAKPAPLLTQGPPAAGLPTLEAWAKDYLRAKYAKPGNVYLGVPHRLDRPVSGVVLFARNSKAAARLAEQFQRHQVTKVYWALVDGTVEPDDGVWADYLRKLPDEARVEVVPPDTPGAKRAELRYHALRPVEGGVLLELRPTTGRTHQLRVQAAARGLPIRGDELYGSRTPFGPPAALPRDRVIALHACGLTFLHPIRYEPVTVTAPLPDYWADLAPG